MYLIDFMYKKKKSSRVFFKYINISIAHTGHIMFENGIDLAVLLRLKTDLFL